MSNALTDAFGVSLFSAMCVLVAPGIGVVPNAQAQHSPQSDAGPATATGAPSGSLTLETVVRATLRSGTAVRTEGEQVNAAEARVRKASGAFDFEVNASASSRLENTLYEQAQRQQLGLSKANQGRTTYELSVSKQFRSGLVVQPRVGASRTDAFTHSSAPILRKEVSLSARYPLLRGRSRSMAAAEEEAARRSLRASRLSLQHTEAESLMEAALAYWDYRAAHRRVRVARRSEERAQTLLNDNKALVEKGERPESVLSQLRANVADNVSRRTEAEQALREARRRVGIAMGISSKEIHRLPAPEESFPAIDDTLDLSPQARVLENVLEERADVQSASVREEAAQSLLEARRSGVEPRLDLRADVGYSGLSDGGGLSAVQHTPTFGQSDASGPTVSIGLNYTFPIGNDAARGRLAQQEATYRQRKITSEDLKRRAKSGVTVALDKVKSSRASVEQAREAVKFYRAAVKDERQKLQHGMSTLLDVTTMEDRLTSARSNLISMLTRYAKALVQLRFEMGRLLLPVPRKERVKHTREQAERLRTLPTTE